MIGQARLEFIFGVVIFGILIFYIASQINTVFTTAATDSGVDVLKTKATNTINFLVSDPGDPENWELSPAAAKRIGLSYENQPYNLSNAKVFALANNCSLLENFDLGGYRLKIYNVTNQTLFCGFVGVSRITASVIKYVYIGGDYGNVTLELW